METSSLAVDSKTAPRSFSQFSAASIPTHPRDYKRQFTRTAAFTNAFTFLLDLDETANWFTNKAAIAAQISTIFGLQASWTRMYRNQPVIGFDNTDTATAVGVVAKF